MDDLTKRRLLIATKPLLSRDDWPRVRDLWQPYIADGDLDAQAQLAYMCLWCFDEPEETDREMRDLLRAAAESGHADAMYWLASVLEPRGARRDELLKRAAELGSRGAQRTLGVYYATGRWTGAKDSTQAVYWYTLAAERNHDDAQYNLGFMLLLGDGAEPSVNEGLRWLRSSAEMGNADAMRLLADLYENGYYGVPKQPDEAEKWKRRYRTDDESRGREEKPACYLHDLEGSL
jgi:TPR repeat protein